MPAAQQRLDIHIALVKVPTLLTECSAYYPGLPCLYVQSAVGEYVKHIEPQ